MTSSLYWIEVQCVKPVWMWNRLHLSKYSPQISLAIIPRSGLESSLCDMSLKPCGVSAWLRLAGFGLVQKWHNSISNALELLLFCSNPSIFWNRYLVSPSYLYNGDYHTGIMVSLYWNSPLDYLNISFTCDGWSTIQSCPARSIFNKTPNRRIIRQKLSDINDGIFCCQFQLFQLEYSFSVKKIVWDNMAISHKRISSLHATLKMQQFYHPTCESKLTTLAILKTWFAIVFCDLSHLIHCDLMIPHGDISLVNTGSGNGLLPGGTKPLPEPIFFTSYQLGQVKFIWGQFHEMTWAVNHSNN